MARIVVLVIPSHVPDQGIARSQDSTERSWFKVSRFCYMLMKYSCDRQKSPKAVLCSLHIMRSTVHKFQPELTFENYGASDRLYSTQLSNVPEMGDNLQSRL